MFFRQIFLCLVQVATFVTAKCTPKSTSMCTDSEDHNCLQYAADGICSVDARIAASVCQRACNNCDCSLCIDSRTVPCWSNSLSCDNLYVQEYCPQKCGACSAAGLATEAPVFSGTGSGSGFGSATGFGSVSASVPASFAAAAPKSQNVQSPSQDQQALEASLKRTGNNKSVILVTNSSVVQCDLEHPCSSGYSCMHNPVIWGTKACFSGVNSTDKNPGKCPAADMVMSDCRGEQCYFDSDCPTAQEKCCAFDACGRICFKALEIDPRPTVTILDEGLASSVMDAIQFKSSVVLVQSKGKNILWDLGAPGQRLDIVKGLRQKAGLEPSDVDLILLSHGHPDHFSNVALFPDVPVNFDFFKIAGSLFLPNEFAMVPPRKLFVAQDPDLEVTQTPGHTLQDTTLFVHNVPGKGTVALCGDVILDEASWFSSSAQDAALMQESRRKVLCSASFVVPGHGSMFQVKEELRETAGGCQGYETPTLAQNV